VVRSLPIIAAHAYAQVKVTVPLEWKASFSLLFHPFSTRPDKSIGTILIGGTYLP